ncbi:MAG: hypothetical protein AB1497_10255 [Bacillota bacterium]
MKSQDRIRLYGHVADLKLAHYDTLLTLAALLEVLEEKGIVSKTEIAVKSHEIDQRVEERIMESKIPPA